MKKCFAEPPISAMGLSLFCDPLSMNLYRQWNAIAPLIEESLLQPNGAQEELVDVLARLLYDSRYTLLIAQKFRPILLLLCAIWLDQHGNEDAKLAALALLIQPHEELFP
jgi:midasin